MGNRYNKEEMDTELEEEDEKSLSVAAEDEERDTELMEDGGESEESSVEEESVKTEEGMEPLTIYVKLQPLAVSEEMPKSKKAILPSYPNTGLDLKLFIETEFQIPVCLQMLSFQSMEIKEKQLLKQIHLREEDVITVSYTTSGKLKEIKQILDNMAAMKLILQVASVEFTRPAVSPDTMEILERFIDPIEVEGLLVNYFIPATSEPSKTNRLYFVHNNGVSLTISIHSLLINIPWDKLTIKMQLLEHSTLRLLWDLSSTIGIRCLLYNYPKLIEQISKSILRVEVVPYKNISPPASVNERRNLTDNYRQAILAETMFKGMGVITNLADMTDFRLDIVAEPNLISQLICALLSPSFNSVCHQIVSSTLVCLSYSTSTHQYLSDPLIIHGLLQACKRFSQNLTNQLTSVNIIISYFITLFFAILSTNSSFVSKNEIHSFIPDMCSFMSRFLKVSTYQIIHQAEIDTCYFSSTIKPLVRLCYFHYEKAVKSSEVETIPSLKELYFISVKAGIFSLQNISLSEGFKEIVENEELVDYLVCLPWYVHNDLKEEADILVQLTAAKMKLQPPKLISIARACLTSCQFSLDDIMSPYFIDNLWQN